MKDRIENMIIELTGNGKLDIEMMHVEYDKLIEKFILNYDASLVPLMKKVISLKKKKNFYYA